MSVPFDLHTHCTLSFDGKSTGEEMVQAAVRLGMMHYALTDHVDLGDFPDPDFDLEATVTGAAELIPALRTKYSDSIDLIYGVELGQAVHDREAAAKLISENDYDFVLGSVHNIRGHDDFYFLDPAKYDPVKLLDTYFDELLETAEWNGADILAHITYPLRYFSGDYGIDIDMSRYSPVIDRIFITLIKNDKGIEINTSGLRQKLGKTMPDAGMIKRYHDLGGRLLTIGSDAHCTDDLGKGIAEGIQIAKECGFGEVAVYKKREPQFIKI